MYVNCIYIHTVNDAGKISGLENHGIAYYYLFASIWFYKKKYIFKINLLKIA